MLAFNVRVDNGSVYFNNTSLPSDLLDPMFEMISLYNSKNLSSEYMKRFILKYFHILIITSSEPGKLMSNIKAGKSKITGSTTNLTASNVTDLVALSKDLNASTQSLNKTPSKSPPTYSKMPNDKDYKKIIMMKFFYLVEKCIQAYKDKSPSTGSNVVVNIFDGVKPLSIEDGRVIINNEMKNKKNN
jgi:hypothetical protein